MSQQISLKFDKIPNTNTKDVKKLALELAKQVGANGIHQFNRPNLSVLFYHLIMELQDSEVLRDNIAARSAKLRIDVYDNQQTDLDK